MEKDHAQLNSTSAASAPAYAGVARDATTYFTGKTETYQRYRPSYPREAIAWILEGLAPRPIVADVGCGTGIASRLFAEAGASVIGVDPNEDMLDAARRYSTGESAIDYRTGTGEATGLDAGSVDCVVCAQSFHWFDRAAALREFHRVLKVAGRVALMWNKRDESDAVAAEYEAITHRAMDLAEAAGRDVRRFRSADPSFGDLFQERQQRRFANPARYTREDLIGRARSASYWPEEGRWRASLEDELLHLFEEHQRDGVLFIAQYSEVTRANRR